jgi:hypothetical protein
MSNIQHEPNLNYNHLLLRFRDKNIDRDFTKFFHETNIPIILVDLIVLVGWSLMFIEDVQQSGTYMWVQIAIRCTILVIIFVCAALLIIPKVITRFTSIILFINVFSLAMVVTTLESIKWFSIAKRSVLLPITYTPFLLGKLD